MIRPIYALALAAACVFACDSPSTGPRSSSARPASTRLERTQVSAGTGTIVAFGSMYGVDEAFVNHSQIRDVMGDDLPWDVGSAEGSLSTDGHLVLHVRGIVFANDPEVPAALRGTNDESQFRALVSCLVPASKGAKVSTVNIITGGFPSTPTGDSDIDTHVQLPSECIAPIIFVMAGSEDKWFAVTGAEIG